jgi:AraC-like DNA-binding protein
MKLINKQNPKEYKAWKAMKSRCYSPANSHKTYQIKGITVCDRWKNSFENFLEDMGSKPSPQHSLDRIDNNLGYSKENCRWATDTIQAKNRGDFNIEINYNGETKILKDWAREFNIKYTTLYQRMYRNGLNFEQAILEDPFNQLIEYKGEKFKIGEWAKKLNISPKVLSDRFKRKWTVERAFTQPVKNLQVVTDTINEYYS